MAPRVDPGVMQWTSMSCPERRFLTPHPEKEPSGVSWSLPSRIFRIALINDSWMFSILSKQVCQLWLSCSCSSIVSRMRGVYVAESGLLGGRGIHFILADHRSRIVILNWGTCGNTWKQFWLSQLGEECYWHLMDEGQGYC